MAISSRSVEFLVIPVRWIFVVNWSAPDHLLSRIIGPPLPDAVSEPVAAFCVSSFIRSKDKTALDETIMLKVAAGIDIITVIMGFKFKAAKIITGILATNVTTKYSTP